jgi:hypothetical protein
MPWSGRRWPTRRRSASASKATPCSRSATSATALTRRDSPRLRARPPQPEGGHPRDLDGVRRRLRERLRQVPSVPTARGRRVGGDGTRRRRLRPRPVRGDRQVGHADVDLAAGCPRPLAAGRCARCDPRTLADAGSGSGRWDRRLRGSLRQRDRLRCGRARRLRGDGRREPSGRRRVGGRRWLPHRGWPFIAGGAPTVFVADKS